MPAERTKKKNKPRASDPCPVCGKVVSRMSDLNRHMKTHDPEAKIPCPYEDCDFRTLQRSNLATHIRRHKNERIFACRDDEDCPFDTVDSASLLRHRKRLHGYLPGGIGPDGEIIEGEAGEFIEGEAGDFIVGEAGEFDAEMTMVIEPEPTPITVSKATNGGKKSKSGAKSTGRRRRKAAKDSDAAGNEDAEDAGNAAGPSNSGEGTSAPVSTSIGSQIPQFFGNASTASDPAYSVPFSSYIPDYRGSLPEEYQRPRFEPAHSPAPDHGSRPDYSHRYADLAHTGRPASPFGDEGHGQVDRSYSPPNAFYTRSPPHFSQSYSPAYPRLLSPPPAPRADFSRPRPSLPITLHSPRAFTTSTLPLPRPSHSYRSDPYAYAARSSRQHYPATASHPYNDDAALVREDGSAHSSSHHPSPALSTSSYSTRSSWASSPYSSNTSMTSSSVHDAHAYPAGRECPPYSLPSREVQAPVGMRTDERDMVAVHSGPSSAFRSPTSSVRSSLDYNQNGSTRQSVDIVIDPMLQSLSLGPRENRRTSGMPYVDKRNRVEDWLEENPSPAPRRDF
ncbi:hypothetical protein CVT26_000477 [Gymnopilus dilepis]|uniref:C2H2-type domain-containing protein n=1 Tax=Gymnopilus dilepis TaxID=231916 RepID=A0A409VH07_9AGAR|nr:hypothetical protein CVT26_000477 [Gymnopilus dilepis]